MSCCSVRAPGLRQGVPRVSGELLRYQSRHLSGEPVLQVLSEVGWGLRQE